MESNPKDVENGFEAFKEFLKQFPDDIYGQIIVEELLKYIMENTGKANEKRKK